MNYVADITLDDLNNAYRQAAKDRSQALETFKMAAQQRRTSWRRFMGMHNLMVTGHHSAEKLKWYEDFLNREADAVLDLQECMRTCKNVIRELDKLLYESAPDQAAH